MSNFRRRLMMSFEKKYTPVKYLESTGTQYIDTGVYPKSTTILDILFSLTEMPSTMTQWRNGWGASNSEETYTWGILRGKLFLNVSSNNKYTYYIKVNKGNRNK